MQYLETGSEHVGVALEPNYAGSECFVDSEDPATEREKSVGIASGYRGRTGG